MILDEGKDVGEFYGVINYQQDNHLPSFLRWLKKQVYSGNPRFALSPKDLLLYDPTYSPFIFIMPEVFDIYEEEVPGSSSFLKEALLNLLKINFSYTIKKQEKIVKVFPCHPKHLLEATL